jgi:hypothetical protein
LGLTPVVDHFVKMQLVKCELLKNSTSEDIQKIYKTQESRYANSQKYGATLGTRQW